MRFIVNKIAPTSLYFVAGPVWHKCLELGFQKLTDPVGGIDFSWRFRTRGSHAGLSIYFEIFSLFFEVTVHDHRHWDYGNEKFLDCTCPQR